MQHTFCPQIPHSFLRIGPTTQKVKTTLTTCTCIGHQHRPALAQSSKGAPHTKSHCPFSTILTNKSRRYRILFFSIELLSVESPQARFPNHQKEDFLSFDRTSTISLCTGLRLPIPWICSPGNSQCVLLIVHQPEYNSYSEYYSV